MATHRVACSITQDKWWMSWACFALPSSIIKQSIQIKVKLYSSDAKTQLTSFLQRGNFGELGSQSDKILSRFPTTPIVIEPSGLVIILHSIVDGIWCSRIFTRNPANAVFKCSTTIFIYLSIHAKINCNIIRKTINFNMYMWYICSHLNCPIYYFTESSNIRTWCSDSIALIQQLIIAAWV